MSPTSLAMLDICDDASIKCRFLSPSALTCYFNGVVDPLKILASLKLDRFFAFYFRATGAANTCGGARLADRFTGC